MTKKPLIILTGPTAVGKTALSLRLAKAVDGEIVSADSMQVYKGMDIGSAKIRAEEMQGVPHHLIDVLEPEEEFHVAEFVRLAKNAMDGIYGRGRIPVVTGGTGFYIQALVKDIDFSEGDRDSALRKELQKIADSEGNEALYAILREEDPEAAAALHPNNVKRVIRALEYHRETGRSMAALNAEQREQASPYNHACFVLDLPRDVLYGRIGDRVDEMIRDGLEEEVRALKARGLARGTTSMQGLGYKEMLDFLDGLCTREEAIEKIKTETRHFAKRQLTWFRREPGVIWIEKQDFADDDAILAEMLRELKARKIITEVAE